MLLPQQLLLSANDNIPDSSGLSIISTLSKQATGQAQAGWAFSPGGTRLSLAYQVCKNFSLYKEDAPKQN